MDELDAKSVESLDLSMMSLRQGISFIDLPWNVLGTGKPAVHCSSKREVTIGRSSKSNSHINGGKAIPIKAPSGMTSASSIQAL